MPAEVTKARHEQKDRRAEPRRQLPQGFMSACSLLGLICLFSLLTSPVLTGEAVPIWDADGWYAPYFFLIADFTTTASWMLWDPWTEAGTPICAEPQAGFCSPVLLLFAWFFGASLQGFVCYWLTVWMLGGAGMLILARYLGAPVWGAFIVASGFTWSGFFTGNAQHTSFIYSFALLPWIIWRLDCGLRTQRWRPVIESGAFWGLSALGGYPGMVFCNAGVIAIWTLGTCCTHAGRSVLGIRLLDAGGRLLALIFTGILVLSPSYFVFYTESNGYTGRHGPLSRDLVTSSNALAPTALTTLTSPGLYWPMRSSVQTDVSSISVYAGAVTAWLAALGLWLRPGESWRWWLVSLALAGALLAVGDSLPFRGWLYDFFAPSQYFRHSSMFRTWIIFSAAVLGALGSSNLISLSEQMRPRLFVYALVSSLGVVGAIHYASVITDAPWGALLKVHLLIIWGGLAALTVYMTFDRTHRERAITIPMVLLAVAVVDQVLTVRLTQPTMWNDDSRLWDHLEADHSPELSLEKNGMQRVLMIRSPDPHNLHLILKKPVLKAYSTLGNRFYHQIVDSGSFLEAATKDWVWFASDPPVVPAHDDLWNQYVQRLKTVKTLPVVVHTHNSGSGNVDTRVEQWIQNAPEGQRLPVRLSVYRPDILEFSVACPADGWIVVLDRWSAGWRATINGRPTPVAKGIFVFRAVPVKTGDNVVRFEYHPRGLPWLIWISWATLSGVAVMSLAGSVRR